MSDLDELTSRVPPPDEPPPPVDWDAARAALGAELPADYRALVERYGAGAIAGLRLLVPGHPNRHVDLLRQVEPQRWALRRLIEQGIEQPYDPDALLPWGIDEGGNVVWWLHGGKLARRRQRGARRGVAPARGRRGRVPGRDPRGPRDVGLPGDRGRRLRAVPVRGRRMTARVLVALVLMLAGCGGAEQDAAQSKSDYERAVRAAVAEAREAGGTPAALRAAGERLRELEPPAEVAGPHRDLVASFDAVADGEPTDAEVDRLLAARRAFAERRYDIGVYGPLTGS